MKTIGEMTMFHMENDGLLKQMESEKNNIVIVLLKIWNPFVAGLGWDNLIEVWLDM